MPINKEKIKNIFEKVFYVTKVFFRLLPTLLMILILFSFFGGFTALFGGAYYSLMPIKETIEFNKGAPEVAIIDLKGVIVSDSIDYGMSSTSSQLFIKLLDYVEKQNNIIGIIMLVNSPGGMAVDSDVIANKIKSLKQNKKIVSYIENVGASGAYLIASQSNKIIAHPQAIIGSIGAKIELPKIKQLAQNIGFEIVTIKSGKLKDLTSPFKDITSEEEKIMQKIVDQSYEYFVGAVAEGRKLSTTEIRQIADGRVFSGDDAKNLKLIDDTGFFNESKKQIEELTGFAQPLTYARYYFRKSAFEKILGFTASKLRPFENFISNRFQQLLYLWE